jgi:hypothetical protein
MSTSRRRIRSFPSRFAIVRASSGIAPLSYIVFSSNTLYAFA